MERKRCGWGTESREYLAYHDREWGVPVHRDRRLFEMLILEGAQAGLSWSTILHKRPAYREAFDRFDPEKVARYSKARIEKLLRNEGIVRNRLKVNAAVRNAEAFLEIRDEFGTFNRFIWGFVDGRQRVNCWKVLADVPAETEQSRAMSKELKRRGMTFVGPTICYAYMQSVGMVNDHLVGCFRHAECRESR
jgi:DNA-3-methyladenine glycosylase I